MSTPVGPRASKEDFMRALGLDANNPQHEPYYRAMRDEAIVVYNYMHRSNSDLLDNYRADPNMRPPYCWHYIRPERQRWGVMEIWRNSGPVTRPLFDRGATHGEYGPNWVTGWLLYSVFRSRDIRNNRHRNQNKKDPGGGGGNGGSSSSSGGSSVEKRKSTNGFFSDGFDFGSKAQKVHPQVQKHRQSRPIMILSDTEY